MVEFIYQYEASIRLVIFLGCFSLLAIWEMLAPVRQLANVKSRRWFSNLSLVILSTIVMRVILPVTAVGTAYTVQNQHWGFLSHFDYPLWMKTLIAFLLLDFFIFIQHMVFHVIPVMWRFHRVHHSDLDCDVTTGLRFHPVEIIISMLLKMMFIIAIGAPVLAVILFEIVLNFMSMFTHSNIRINKTIDTIIRWLLVTPDMHRIHHSARENETNSNFGFHISVWDRLLGTYIKDPQDDIQNMTLGLSHFREDQWQGVSGLIRLPFHSHIKGYAINHRDTYNAEQLELAQQLAQRNHEKAELANELSAYLDAIGQHAIVSVTDTSGVIIEVNEKFCEVSGYRQDELIGQTHRIVNSGIHPKSYFAEMWHVISNGGQWSGDVCNKTKNGDYYWVNSTIIPIKDEHDKINRYVSVRLDITERKKKEEELQQAYHNLEIANQQLELLTCIDGLTGISNRRHFDSYIHAELNLMRRIDSHLALILYDVDEFKKYNDSYGHLKGDDCLKNVAQALSSVFSRSGDMVARYGGEEFAIVLPNTNQEVASKLAEAARKAIEDLNIEHNSSNVSNVVTVSVGLTALIPDKNTNTDTVINQADQALYNAKENGRNSVCIY